MSGRTQKVWPRSPADALAWGRRFEDDGSDNRSLKLVKRKTKNSKPRAAASVDPAERFSAGSGVEIVYDQGVPTETSNYTVLLNNIRAAGPDAVIHLGYAPNDIAFLRNVQDSGTRFKFLFSIYPGLETELLEKNVGTKGLNYVYTYVPSSELAYEVNAGMPLKDFKEAWHKAYGNTQVEFGFNSVAGYTTGIVLEKALAAADSLDQLELRRAMMSLSGKLKTLDGTFELDATGAQIGENTPIGQMVDDNGTLGFVTVWPKAVATGKPVYPRP